MMKSSVALLLCLVAGSQAALDTQGKEFIVCYTDNKIQSGVSYDVEMYVTTTANTPAQVNVTAPLQLSSWSESFSVSRGNIHGFTIDTSIRGDGTALESKGVLVTASEDVTVYSVNKETYSTDGFIAFPTDTLGTSYVAITWTGTAEIMVAATVDSTSVTFTFPSTYTTSDITYNGVTYTAGDSLTVTLNRLQTFQVYSASGDLTGTQITSTNPITAFSGNLKVAVTDTNTQTSSDHLVEQLIPTTSWGKDFVTVCSPDRVVGDYVRVVAAEDSTTYTLDSVNYTLNAYQYNTHNLPSGAYYRIQADKGVMVAIFSKTLGSSSTNDGVNGGDPAMSLAVPVALYGADYTFSTVQTTVGPFTNYVIVVIKDSLKSGLVLDNVAVTNANWLSVVGSSEYVATVLSVSDGSHSIYNTDPTAAFLAMAYGNAQFNSYAYPTGLRLAPINAPCNTTSTVAGDGVDNDCDGAIDEETDNGIDDDGDGTIDEDLAVAPRVDGNWSDWSNWTSCSVTCGGGSGSQTRTRTCDNPAPQNNGLDCSGDSSETTSCTGSSTGCPVDGNWSDWGSWASCSVTCGGGSGSQTRTRTCDNPAPQNNGLDCSGDSSESTSCTGPSTACPVDGNWSDWSNWTSCSVTCGGGSGSQTRTRTCDNPAPQNNGLDCTGDSSETASCTGSSTGCPVDGGWGDWASWSSCSVTCGSGQLTRDRQCDNPAAQNGGQDCSGSGSESNNCTISPYCLPSYFGNILLGCSGSTQFGCATGTIQCIDLAFRCDGSVDCDDGSDENEYFAGCTATSCPRSAAGEPTYLGALIVCGIALFLAQLL